MYALIFQHHAKLVNIVGNNDIRTNIVVAIKNSRPKNSRQAKTRTDVCNGTTNVQWDHVQAPFRNVPINNWDPHSTKSEGLLCKGDVTTLIIMINVRRTILDLPKLAGALRGPGLIDKDSYKKPVVPVSVQQRVVRVRVVFVTVEVVNAAKMVNLHGGPGPGTHNAVTVGLVMTMA